MKCCRCKDNYLIPKTLPNHLKTHTCQNCQNQWISSLDYEAWLRIKPGQFCQAVIESIGREPENIQYSHKAKICSGCNHIMSRYSIRADINFQLNHCAHCGSFGLDVGQWETLEYHQLHQKFYMIVSPYWQQKLRQI